MSNRIPFMPLGSCMILNSGIAAERRTVYDCTFKRGLAFAYVKGIGPMYTFFSYSHPTVIRSITLFLSGNP